MEPNDHPAGYYRTIINAVRDPLLVIDKDMGCVFMNEAACVLLKVDESSYRNRPCFELVRDFDSACWEHEEECPVREALENGEVVRIFKELKIHSSLIRTYEISAVPIKNEAGKITEVVEILRDVTASFDHMKLRELTAKIEQAKKELGSQESY